MIIKSVLSDKVEYRDKSSSGKGAFAKEKICKGEIVFIKGGHILKKGEYYTSSQANSYLPISDNYVLAAGNPEEENEIKLFVNHSCNPNCGLRGEITFVAIRDIDIDEELTFDYAFLDNEDYKFNCTCGAINCRKIITGRDWKIKEIQEKYGNYFALYLKEKIAAKNE